MNQEKRLVLDWTKAHDVFPVEKLLSESFSQIVAAKSSLAEKTGIGSEWTSWMLVDKEENFRLIAKIKEQVENINQHSDAVVVIGIGGSLLGTKAVYEALTHSFSMVTSRQEQSRKPLLFWAGHHLSLDELSELIDALDSYSPSLIVVSKSGGTTEPALAFRILRSYLEDRFGCDETNHRIFVVTDPQDGSLLQIAQKNQYTYFPIPRGIGGRYSVLTAVGLFPLAIAGLDILEFCAGAEQAAEDCLSNKNNSIETNPALCYAGIRNIFYENNYKIECLCTWSPKTKALAEWWKQLFGESDGKQNSGLFPTSAHFTTDLHSLGQYFQEGERHFFATHLRICDEYSLVKGVLKRKIKIPSSDMNDGFQFLAGSDLSLVQSEAQQASFLAHADGGVPTLVWDIPNLDEWWLGYWMYTNMFACAVANYARRVNPFDQPGVELYKNNMFSLLGKPGYADKAAQLKGRLQSGHRLRALGLSNRSSP